MNKHQLLLIIIILMARYFQLMTMEEALHNPIEWKPTHLSELKYGQLLTGYDWKRGTEVFDNSHDNTSVYNVKTLVQRYNSKYIKTTNNNEVNLTKIPVKSNLNVSNEHNQATDKIKRNTTTAKLNIWNWNIQKIKQNKLNETDDSRNVTGFNEPSNRQLMLRNCENECDNIWKPLTDYNKDILVNNNQDQYMKPTILYPAEPLLSRLKTYNINYKSDNSVINNSNQWPNNLYNTRNILNNDTMCTSSSMNVSQSCSTNLVNNTFATKHFVVPNNYNNKTFNFNTHHPTNIMKTIQYKFIRNNNKHSYGYHESDLPNVPPPDATSGNRWKAGLSEYNDQIQFPPHDDPSNNAVGFPNDDKTNLDKANKNNQDFKISYPTNSYSFTDYNKFNKWHYMQNDVNHFEDKLALSRLQDMYYCNKYCKCCKKGRRRVTFKYYEYGLVGKVLSIMKHFGFSSGHDFFYGRTPVPRSDSHNPLNYVRDYYHRYYGHPVDMYMDDEIFVFHDPHKGVPFKCKEVCTCCEDNKKEKLRRRLNEMKRKEALRKRRLQGFTGMVRYLLFSDGEGYYDFIGVKSRGRSYTGNYHGTSHNRRKVVHYPDYGDSDSEDTFLYDTDGYHASYEGGLLQPDHESHDVHHEYKVEDHHDSKLIVFNCKKCCGFCKKPKEPLKRRRRRIRLGLFDFLRSLVTGESLDEDDLSDNDSAAFGDVTISISGGSQEAYNEISGSGGSHTVADPSSPSNSSMLTPAIIAVAIAKIIVQGFSALNIAVIVIVPLILFSLIIIVIFLVLPVLIAIFFIPILIIALAIILIPIVLLAILFFLLLPLLLVPVVLPFILRLPGIVPGSISRIANITCVRLVNFTISCSITSTTPVSQLFVNDTMDVIDSVNTTAFENTTSVSLIEFNIIDNSTIEGEGQLKILNSLYWKINTALRKDYCLERAGCLLATYTNSYGYYNKFILRILENLSLSMNEPKFTAYKDAYQIGSLNITNHEKCATLYYCKK